MERSPVRDFVVGLFVLAGFAALAYLSVTVAGFSWKGKGGLKLTAAFNETGGLAVRAPVVIAGVRVGEVTRISLEDKQGVFRALVQLDLDPSLQLTSDTGARIVTAGVLGDRYVELQPGGEDKILRSGDRLGATQSAVILEQLIGNYMSGMGGGKSATPATAPGQ